MSGWPLYVPRKALTYDKGIVAENREVNVVTEKPLTVFLNHNELATLICSPGGLQELTVGFLLSEGILKEPSDIEDIRLREDDGLLWIETTQPVSQTDNFLRRHIASCCGKGRAGLASAGQTDHIPDGRTGGESRVVPYNRRSSQRRPRR